MNKKIKVIELLNKIANGQEVPELIKYKNQTYGYGKENWYWKCGISYLEELFIDKNFLNDYVEILDKPEEIEDIEEATDIYNGTARGYGYLVDKINELVRTVNQMRKEREWNT